jgi:hypothetical protein
MAFSCWYERQCNGKPLFLPQPLPEPPVITLVHAAGKQTPSPLWPTGHAEGKQLLLFA